MMKQILALIAVACSLMSCASMSRQRDENAFKKVKTAAVVALIVKEPASDKFSMDLGSGKSSVQMGGTSFYKVSDGASEAYQDLTLNLAKTTGWTVLPQSKVAGNEFYQQQAKKFMAPIQIMKTPPSGQNWYLAKDIMVPDAADLGGRDSRNQLLNALGVDVLVVATIDVSVKGGFSLNGLGPRRPQSEFEMKVYERDNENNIWRERIEGAKSEESLGWIGFIDENRLDQLARESTRTALMRINSEIK